MATVLLLDVDGVLHPLGSNHLPLAADLSELSARADEVIAHGDEDGFTTRALAGEFTESCMTALKTIVRESGCTIVLSSTWREQACDRRCVDDMLRRHGLPASCSCTPVAGGGRVAEILAWVREARPLRWIAVDDTDLSSLPAGHFWRTRMEAGLTQQDAEAIVAMLRSQVGADDSVKCGETPVALEHNTT